MTWPEPQPPVAGFQRAVLLWAAVLVACWVLAPVFTWLLEWAR